MNLQNVFANIARRARRGDPSTKLLVIKCAGGGADGTIEHHTVGQLPHQLRRGDVLVVNDAATVPASLMGWIDGSDSQIELRLAVPRDASFRRWTAVLFGRGEWHTPTEQRAAPPIVYEAQELCFAFGLRAVVQNVHHDVSPRLLDIEFRKSGPALWQAMYAAGRPVQYSYLDSDLKLWDQQTLFAAMPAAVEAPSASFPLSWELMAEVQRRGVQIVAVTHGTGLSSTGDPAVDQRLPFKEPYQISETAQDELLSALESQRRIIAVGTGTTRALESWGGVRSTKDWCWTDLKITRVHHNKVVRGLLTGLHESQSSHLKLLSSFAEPGLLADAYAEAAKRGYKWHEYGDVCLILP